LPVTVIPAPMIYGRAIGRRWRSSPRFANGLLPMTGDGLIHSV